MYLYCAFTLLGNVPSFVLYKSYCFILSIGHLSAIKKTGIIDGIGHLSNAEIIKEMGGTMLEIKHLLEGKMSEEMSAIMEKLNTSSKPESLEP